MLSFDLSRLRLVAAMILSLVAVERAHALTIELKDVAPDRVERQRAAATGALPLPGTPNVAVLQERLREKSVTLASPILIRIFKAESELEIWKQTAKDGAFVLFATYPICHWSGTLGPKLRDGDRQAPEGFYTVSRTQARHVGRWPISIDVGYPNILDQSQARTGSDILIHGGCSSIGCFAMTNPVSEEIHQLTLAAIDAGEDLVPVQILPFRMTNENMIAQNASPWKPFWNNLKEGYDLFEQTKRPPMIGVCSGRYVFNEGPAGALPGPLDVCGPTLASIREQDQWLDNVPPPSMVLPKLATQAADAKAAPIPQIQTSLESDTPPPMFSWPLVR
ncbi:murein L,D-transpeptidase family protein [Hyphomicrobium sp.]|jgi:murein L,D-transpeptidase YafK|uniref:L,D-transpeptidase family protein n=1 Tax=Hyphomicrobium sp. TaxID=82 RepID=UPI0035635769